MGNYLKMADRQRILALLELGWSYRRFTSSGAKPAKVSPMPQSAAEPYRELIQAAVAQGLTAQRIWQDLREDYGFGHGYSSVKRLVRRIKKEHPIAVAQRLAVTRESVYAWVRRLRREETNSLAQRLRDQPRSGRPRGKGQAAQQMVQKVMNTDPSKYGYWAEGWTLGLLQHHLKTTQDVEVSEATVRRSLRGMGYQWKRPRYVLARRDPHWRQAKGESPSAYVCARALVS